jgi:light-regulated signal transduction histidine kinase (bacteriophytochrome)
LRPACLCESCWIGEEMAPCSLGSGAAREVNIHVPTHLPAYADPGLLQIVLENLLANAWKFTSRTPHAIIWLGVEQSDRRAFYERDNGAGFDMQRAERLFAPFERMHTQSRFPGTGVGLPTVQRIVQRHSGARSLAAPSRPQRQAK